MLPPNSYIDMPPLHLLAASSLIFNIPPISWMSNMILLV
jgi:hypothetical protein